MKDLVSIIGSIIGAVGGLLGLVSWIQVQRDRRGVHDYRAFVDNVIQTLRSGVGNSVDIAPEQHRWAARAVDEGLVVWSPGGKGLMLPP